MKADTIMSLWKLSAFFVFSIFLGFSMFYGAEVFLMDGSIIPEHSLTGMVTLEDLGMSPTYEGDELSGEEVNAYDTMILDECSNVHRNAGDCFDIIKSIISITSRGDEGFSSDLGDGIVPLDAELLLDEEYEIDDPEDNIRSAVRYLMRLYDSYSGDIGFTALAYFAGRATANDILYSIDSEEGAIQVDMIFQDMENIYPHIREELELDLEVDDIKQYFVDFLIAYSYWTDRPVPASSSARMFDYGTYSVRPSFRASLKYDITQISFAKEIIDDFVEHVEQGEQDTTHSFQSLMRHIDDNYGEEDISRTHYSDEYGESSITVNGLTWKEGMCNPMLDDFNRITDRIIQCADIREYDCYCDFSDLAFDYEDMAVRIAEDEHQHGKEIVFQLVRMDGREVEEVFEERRYVAQRDGIREEELFFGMIDAEDHDSFDSTDDFSEKEVHYRRSPDDTINSLGVRLNPYLIKSDLDEGTGVGFSEDSFDTGEECGIQEQYEYICILSNNTMVYDDSSRDYSPLSHEFAFSFDPIEMQDEDEYVLEEEDFSTEQVSTGIGDLRISPSESCEERDGCTEQRFLGIPLNYINERQRITVHRLDYETMEDALDNMISHSRAPLSNIGMHYIIDNDAHVHKLAREDAVLPTDLCHDHKTISIGVVTDSLTEQQNRSIVRLSSEILLRNDIGILDFRLHDNLESPDDGMECRISEGMMFGESLHHLLGRVSEVYNHYVGSDEQEEDGENEENDEDAED